MSIALSHTTPGWMMLVTWFAAISAPGCGWHLGPGPHTSLTVASVSGAVVDPGLREEIRGEVVRALARQGAHGSGPVLELEVRDAGAAVTSVMPGSTGAVLDEELILIARVPAWPGCEVQVRGQRSWSVGYLQVDSDVEDRDAARADLARLLASRVVDALMGSEACQSRS